MTRIKITRLEWDNWNIRHIKKHNISKQEIKEVCSGTYKQQPTYRNRHLIFGKTKKGKLLTIVLARKAKGKFYIVTARSMSRRERKQFIK